MTASYAITATADPPEGGWVEGAGDYDPGQTVTLRANVVENYFFQNWTEGEDIVSTEAIYSFTAEEDRDLVAHFARVPAISSVSPASAAVGTEVTIGGVGFGASRGSSYVSFENVQATEYTAWSDTQVKCKVPAGLSGGVFLFVTAPGGVSGGYPFGVKPAISGSLPASGIAGDEITISGSAFGPSRGSSYVSFGGMQATEYTAWSDAQVKCKVPTGASGVAGLSVTTAGGTSNEVVFHVLPYISDIYGGGTVGDGVAIYGTGFGASQGSSYISFGDLPATEYTLWSSTEVACKIPEGASGSVALSVTTSGGKSNEFPFGVAPFIDLAPSFGSVGTEVTIEGIAFGESQGSSYVSFGEIHATEYTTWSDTEVKCKVPAGVSGIVNLSLTTSGGPSAEIPFHVIPSVSGVSPTSGTVGMEVTITGNGFGANRGSSYVSFGGVLATEYTLWSDTEVKCKVPAGAAGGTLLDPIAGTISLSLITSGGESNAVPFSVIPFIGAVSPTSGAAGTEVMLTGTGFGGDQGSSYVSFGTVKASQYTAWSDTQVKCKVPVAASGAISLTVTTAGGTSNGVPFKVKPKLGAVSPLSGASGATITITGSGFGATRGTSYVSFGSVKATIYTSWTNTKIVCKVPAGAAGAVNLSVTTAGGKSNTIPFKVKPKITTLSPTSGVVGTVVTITGTGFGATRGTSYVSFGATKAVTYVSWSNTTIKCKVPSVATGAKAVKATTPGGTSNGMTFTVK